MSQVLAEFAEPVLDDAGVVYRAQAAGAARPDGLWEGWIEFIPVAGGVPLRTPHEKRLSLVMATQCTGRPVSQLSTWRALSTVRSGRSSSRSLRHPSRSLMSQHHPLFGRWRFR